jgi:hypothetical protein
VRTLSEHIFDLVQNSLAANAKNIQISVEENVTDNLLKVVIKDDGHGIKPEHISRIKNTFFTTRPKSDRQVGLGLSLMDAACNRSGGKLIIESRYRYGTTIICTMEYDNIDRPPNGDLSDLFTSLMLSTPENKVIWTIDRTFNDKNYRLKNRTVKDELNIFSFEEPGIRDMLYRFIVEKEKGLHV